MQKSQFTHEQIVPVLQQAEEGDKPVDGVCYQHKIEENTFYRWRNRLGGLDSKKPPLSSVKCGHLMFWPSWSA